MIYPADLPNVIEYRCGKTVRISLPRQPVKYISTSGNTNAAQICPMIPYGCDGWRLSADKDWRPLKTIPAHWMPFLNRERGTELDPRPKKAEAES